MRSETKTKTSKTRFVDLDSALLSLKHSRLSQIASGVRGLPKSVPAGADFLTRIGLNVLERAQSVRKSLMQSVKTKSAKKSKKPQLKKAVTAKAATPKAKAVKRASKTSAQTKKTAAKSKKK